VTAGIVYILKENLAEFAGIFDELRKIPSFSIEMLALDDFLTMDRILKLQELGPLKCMIIVERGIYLSNRDRLSTFLKSTFKYTFTNTILIDMPTGGDEARKYENEAENSYQVSKENSFALQTCNLHKYILQLYRNSILSDRLTSYISDSFKVVVYSELISKKNKEIEILNKELENKNKIDNLTNLYNRSALFDLLEQERKRTVRDLWRLENCMLPSEAKNLSEQATSYDHEPIGNILDHFGIFSILMIDLDNFKSINDTYGHLAGDSVLRILGGLFQDKRILRESDMAGRFGGEEFIIILPETNSNNALGPATRLAEKFNQVEFTAPTGETFSVSLSIGISEFHAKDKTCEDIIARADKALYYAKDHGRNQIVVYERVFM
jgi:diguanylate cyclase (GGDEF)-like protein